MTSKAEVLKMLPPNSAQYRYLKKWTNDYGTDNGWDGHIMAIWQDFWKSYHKGTPRKLGGPRSRRK